MSARDVLNNLSSEEDQLVEVVHLGNEAVAEICELSQIMAALLTDFSADRHLLALRGMAVRCNELALAAHASRYPLGPSLTEMRDLMFGRCQPASLGRAGGGA